LVLLADAVLYPESDISVDREEDGDDSHSVATAAASISASKRVGL